MKYSCCVYIIIALVCTYVIVLGSPSKKTPQNYKKIKEKGNVGK